MRLLPAALLLLLVAGCAAPPPPATGPAAAGPGLHCLLAPCGRAAIAHGGEPWVAADPQDHARAAVVAQGGGPAGTLSHPWLTVATTADGGAHWRTVTPPGGVNDPSSSFGSYDFVADVAIAYAADGGLVVSALLGRGDPFLCAFALPPTAPRCLPPDERAPSVFVNALDLVVWRSDDGGATFVPGPVVARSQGALDSFQAAGRGGGGSVGAWNDRDALAADAATGTLVLAWDLRGQVPGDLTTQFHLMASCSTDGGRTWSAPQGIGSDLYGASAAAANGTVIVTARRMGTGGFVAVRSTDGGATWSAPQEVADAKDGYDLAPVALWGPGGRDAVLAYTGPGGDGVWLRRSGDGGTSWAAPEGPYLNGTPTLPRLPVLAVDARGRGLLASYLKDTPDGGLHVHALGLLGGRAVGAPFVVSGNATTDGTRQDYFGAAALDGRAWLAWTEEGFVVPAAPLALPA